MSFKDTKDLRKAFEALDANGDGRISKEELMQEYSNIMGVVEAERLVDDIME